MSEEQSAVLFNFASIGLFPSFKILKNTKDGKLEATDKETACLLGMRTRHYEVRRKNSSRVPLPNPSFLSRLVACKKDLPSELTILPRSTVHVLLFLLAENGANFGRFSLLI